MSLQIYNTQTKQKAPFKSIEPDKVKMYVCGPTVYNYLHIGNFRGAIFFNLFAIGWKSLVMRLLMFITIPM